MNEEMSVGHNGILLINKFKPSYTITMNHSDGEVVGRFDFNGPKLIFTGDAEESAKVFVNYLTMIWDKRLQEEREAEREACAKVCEKQIKSYLSKQYTTDPLGGLRERFAAEQCAAAIRARGEP
jgi:hypothetical protein